MSLVKKLRVGAALAAVTAISLMSGAGTAAAAEPSTGKVVDATDEEKQKGQGLGVNLLDAQGKPIVREEGKPSANARIIILKVGDKRLWTYCVDFETTIKQDADYVETPWDKYPNTKLPFAKNSAKINWVLHHGYPSVDPDTLDTKVPGDPEHGGLNIEEAVTATQAALWHFSDGLALNQANPTPAKPEYAKNVKDLYNYLVGPTNVGLKDEPQSGLILNPSTLSGKPGTLIGPFVVGTTSDGVNITAKLPAGVLLTDKDGKELEKAEVAKALTTKNKYEFYVKVAAGTADGKVEFTVAGKPVLEVGRLFVNTDYPKHPSQSLILAQKETVPFEVKGTANWAGVPVTTTPTETTPAPQPKATTDELAATGASIVTPIVIGVVLVGAGVGAIVFQRRRRRV